MFACQTLDVGANVVTISLAVISLATLYITGRTRSTVATTATTVNATHEQVLANGGSTLADAVNRIEQVVQTNPTKGTTT